MATGTGSGKLLAYFIPIVDDVLRRKRADDTSKGSQALCCPRHPTERFLDTRTQITRLKTHDKDRAANDFAMVRRATIRIRLREGR